MKTLIILIGVLFCLVRCQVSVDYTYGTGLGFVSGMSENLIEAQYNLTTQLMTGYNKIIQASIALTGIQADINFNQIISMNEKTQIMTTGVLLKFYWKDSRLSWNATEYDINNILIPASSIWVPDFFVINTADSNGFINIPPQSLALVDSNGNVYLAISLSSLNTRCDMNIMSFPYDTQKCPITIGSWQCDSSRFSFKSLQSVIDLSEYTPNPLWNLISVKKMDVSAKSRFVNKPKEGLVLKGQSLSFIVKVQRLPLIYILNNVFPCLILNAVIQLAFFMPFAQQGGLGKYLIILKCKYF